MEHGAKRFLSWLLTLAMLLSLLPTAALAADEEDAERTYLVEYADGTRKSFGLEELWAEARTHVEDEGDEVTIDGLHTTWAQYKSALALQDLTDLAEQGVIGPYDLTDEAHLPYITSLMKAMGVSSAKSSLLLAEQANKIKLYNFLIKSGDNYHAVTFRDRETVEYYPSKSPGWVRCPPYENPNILFSLDDSDGAQGWQAKDNPRFNVELDRAERLLPDIENKARVYVTFTPTSGWGNEGAAYLMVYRVYNLPDDYSSKTTLNDNLEAKVNYTIYPAKGEPITGTLTLPVGQNSVSYKLQQTDGSTLDLLGGAAVVVTAGENTVIDRSQRAVVGDSTNVVNWKYYKGDVLFSFKRQTIGATESNDVVAPSVFIPGGSNNIYAPGDNVPIVLYTPAADKQIAPTYTVGDNKEYGTKAERDLGNPWLIRVGGSITVTYNSTDGGQKTATVPKAYTVPDSNAETFSEVVTSRKIANSWDYAIGTRAIVFDWKLPFDYKDGLKVTGFTFDLKEPYSVALDAAPTLTVDPNDKLCAFDMDNAHTEIIKGTGIAEIDGFRCLIIPMGASAWLSTEAGETEVMKDKVDHLRTVYATFGASDTRQKIYIRRTGTGEELECLIPVPWDLFSVLHIHSKSDANNDDRDGSGKLVDHSDPSAAALPYAIHEKGGMSVSIFNNQPSGVPYEADESTTVYTDTANNVTYHALKNADDATVVYNDVWKHFAGDAETVAADSRTKINPAKYNEYVTANGSVPLTLTYTAAQQKATTAEKYAYASSFSWVSSDTKIATIDAKTGEIAFTGEIGEVAFYLVNANGGEPVAVKTAALRVIDSPDPYLYVPTTSKTVTTREDLPVTVRFTNNLSQRNAAVREDGDLQTTYTVSLTGVDAPYTVTGTMSNPVSSCVIPSLSVGTYTATVTATYVGEEGEGGQTFNDTATIVVKPKPATITLTPPTSKDGLPYVLDNTNPTVTWSVNAVGEKADWKYEIVDSEGVVKASGKGNANASYTFPKTESKLKEVYTVTVYATNDENEDGWTVATSRVYVYNSSALDILVHESNHLTQTATVDENGKPLDTLELNNREWVENHLNEDRKTLNFAGMNLSFEELQQDMNLSAVVSLNYGDYQWGNLSDMIRWDAAHTATYEGETAPNPDGGVFYYHTQGLYYPNGTYGNGSYFPRSEFVEQGLRDGTVNITATHAATGQQTTVQVDVDRMEDVFYLFRFRRVAADGSTGAGVTEVTYWDNKDHEKHTVSSDSEGQMALYEPLGIDRSYPIYLRSTQEDSPVYFGVVEPGTLLSGEVDAIQGETYPVNVCELYRPDQVTLRIFDPNGQPLKNKALVLRGGAYYNDLYQPRADVFTGVSLTDTATGNIGDENRSNGLGDIAVTTDGNGEISLNFNLAQVADGNVDVTKPIQYVFELHTNEMKNGKPIYRPAIVRVNPVAGRSVNVLLLSYNGSNVYLNAQGGQLNLTTASNRATAPYINALTLHRSATRSTALRDSIAATKDSNGTRLQTYSGLPDEKAEILPLSGNAGAKLGPNEQYPETVLEYETVMRGFENLIELDANGQATIKKSEREAYTQYFYDPDTRTTLGNGYTVENGQQVSRLWVYPFSSVPLMTTVLQLDEAGFGLNEKGEATNATWLPKYNSTLADVHLYHNRTSECDLPFAYRLVNSVGAIVPTESRRAIGQIARLVNALETDMNGFSLEKLLGKDSKVAGYVAKVLDQIIRRTVGYSIKPYYAATVDPTVYYVYLKVDPSIFQQMLSQSLGVSFVDLAEDELTKVVMKELGVSQEEIDYEEMERRLGERIENAAQFGINPSFAEYEDLFSHVEMPKDGQGEEWDIYSFAAFMDSMAYQHEGQLLARAEYDLKNQQWNMFYMDGVVNSMLQLGFGQGINVFPGVVVNIGGMAGVDKMYKAKNVYQTKDIHRYDMVRQFSVGGGIELSGGVGAEAGIFSVFFGPYGIIKYTSNNATLTSTSHNEADTKVEVTTTHGNKHSLYGQAGLKFEVSAWIFSESVDMVSVNFKIKDWPDDQYKKLERLWGAKPKGVNVGVLGAVSYQVMGDPASGQMTLMLVRDKMITRSATPPKASELYRQYGDEENITVSAVSDDGEYVFYLDDLTASWADAKNGTPNGSLVEAASRSHDNNNSVGDFGHFYLDASGKSDDLFAVWSTQTQDFQTETDTGNGEVTLSDVAAMMNSGEITVARYNGSGWVKQNLTSNTVPDLMPKIASNGSKAAVAWLSGSSSDTDNVTSVTQLGNFDVDNKIQFSRTENGTDWSTPQTLVNLAGMGQVTGLDTAVLSDGTAIVAYAVNLGNTEDTTGQEIFYTIVPTNGAPKTFRATENKQLDARPQLAVVKNAENKEEAVLAWYAETANSNAPAIQLLGFDKSGKLDSKLPEGFSGSDDAPVTQNFRMDGDSLSGLTLAWLVNETANAGTKIDDAATYRSALYGVQLYADDNRCVVSLPQRLLATDENVTGSDFLLSADGKAVKAILSEAVYSSGEYEKVSIDTSEMVETEGEEEPSLSSITVQIPKMYHKTEQKAGAFTDTLTVADIQYNADLVAPNTKLPISFTVLNTGVDKITDLKLKNVEQPDVVLYPGESKMVRTIKTFESTVSDYTYDFTATGYKEVSGTIPFNTPAVRITGMSVTAPGDKPLDGSVSSVVSNDGKRTVTLTLENPSGSFIPLTGSDKTLTVQLFADMEGSQAISDPKTVSDYALLDSGAVMVSLDTNAKAVLNALREDGTKETELEIPEAGLPVFALASVTEGENVVSTAVNMTTLTLLSPADKNGEPGVTVSVSDWNQSEDSGDMNILLRLDNSSLYEKKDVVARVTVCDAKNLPVAVVATTDTLAGESTEYKTLSFKMPEKTEAAYITAELMDEMALEEKPEVEGFTFNGWYTDVEYKKQFERETEQDQNGEDMKDEDGNLIYKPITVSEDGTFTVYAKWTRRSSGGGSSSGSASAATTITAPVTGDAGTVSVTTTVKGNDATIAPLTAAQVDSIVGSGTSGNQTSTVAIDVSNLGTQVSSVTIPADTVKAIEAAVSDTKKDADSLTVKLSEGSITFDADAVKAITEETKSDGLKVNLDDVGTEKLNTAQKSAISDLAVETVLDAYVTSGAKRISDFKGGSATVSVKHTLKASQSPAGIVVWYVADDGTRTQIPASFRNGEVVFTVTHFSNYVIAYDAEKAAAAGKLDRFVDLDSNAWYADGVLWALNNGVMNGWANPLGAGMLFGPNDTTTRAMVATMLWRLEGSPVVSGEMKFVDVAEGTWYTEAVRWASDAGIITGSKIPAKTTPWPMGFRPNDAVTREQLAAMLYRYAQYKKADVSASASLSSYGDAQTVSSWATSAMQWACGSGIINGIGSNLVPAGNASRAQVATMLMRYSAAK